MTSSSEHYDVVVIGSGPAGGTTAAKLAEAGHRVLLLERGGFLPRERGNWDSDVVFGKARYTADETWYDRDGETFHPELHYWVGGNSKVYGAALFRLLPQDFGEVRHPKGSSPAWPITYDELEPHYVEAERMFWVHGQRGEDPFEGRASHPYFHPPVQHEPRIQQLSDDLTKIGLHPFHLPVGVHLDQQPDGSPTLDSRCIRCNRVDGFPCLVGAKADAEWAVIRPALAAHPDRLTLVTGATVEKLETDGTGRTVTGVVARMADGSQQVFSGDLVVLSAGSLLSAVLLLRSANDRHPNGLANSSDVVGRHYMRHNNLALMAFSKEPNPTVFQKTLSLNDFYGPTAEWEFPMGNIQMLGKSDGLQVKSQAPKGLGIGPITPYDLVAKHSVDFWLASEDLPRPDSRVSLRRDGSVQLVVQPENDMEGLHRLRHALEQALGRSGFSGHTIERDYYLHKAMDVSATAHQAGTVRFGTDPATSALDVDCKAHDLDNLYVVDGSFMPSIGAVNPTLTIIANAVRVAERIDERLAA